MDNPFEKTADIDSPYAIYVDKRFSYEYKVLKTYQTKDKESKNHHAKWKLAIKSPFTLGSYEIGDDYCLNILLHSGLVEATDEWKKVYGN
tara:strand:+ start:300 stop:569 length:270 start_codon:yes stop_codon:yes gene_type:complete